MDLAGRVRAFFAEHGLIDTTGVVAVSGGPDSMVLADVLMGLLRRGELRRLTVAHLNHQLRGDESDADESFVRGHFDVETVTDRVDIARLAAAAQQNLEEAARDARYRWLSEMARRAGAGWVATGHTADDQAETVLFRLLRGSGLQGLSGMPPRRPLAEGIELIRPLLDVRRSEVLQYLGENKLPFRTDTSNADPRFTRNRIRHDLIPHLQQYNPAVVGIVGRLAKQARGVQTELAARAKDLLATAELPRAGIVLVFRIDALAGQSEHLVAEVFRQVWRRESWPLDAMGYEDWQHLVAVLAGSCQAWEFPGRVRAQRAGRVVQIKQEPQPMQREKATDQHG
jgi:tRNA(Ile)-lysidine synthase